MNPRCAITDSRIGKEPRTPRGGEDYRHEDDHVLPGDLELGSLTRDSFALALSKSRWVARFELKSKTLSLSPLSRLLPIDNVKRLPYDHSNHEGRWYDRLRRQETKVELAVCKTLANQIRI